MQNSFIERFNQLGELPGPLLHVEDVIVQHHDSGGVVSPVLKPLQSTEQYV